VIVAVCADKGAPGVTTLAVALGLVWPGRRLVLEADPSGGSLTFRTRRADTGGMLSLEPSVASLGAACRLGVSPAAVSRYVQPTTLGVDVVPGVLTPERYEPMRGLWPQVGSHLAGWPGTVIADLGRVQPGNSAMPVARAATAVLLLGRADTEGLFGLRERAADLVHSLGDPSRDRPSLSLVLTGPAKQRKDAVRSAEQMLTAAGIPVPVAGYVAEDLAGAQGLWAGQVTRKVAGSDLVRSARALAETVIGWWPHLAVAEPTPTTPEASESTAGDAAAVDGTVVDGTAAHGRAGVNR
jgi:hypothetical protein